MAPTCARVCVYCRDEREAAGNCPVGLFLFHPSAGGQSLDTTDDMLESEESVEGLKRTPLRREHLHGCQLKQEGNGGRGAPR